MNHYFPMFNPFSNLTPKSIYNIYSYFLSVDKLRLFLYNFFVNGKILFMAWYTYKTKKMTHFRCILKLMETIFCKSHRLSNKDRFC
jgi:hypothetical protein